MTLWPSPMPAHLDPHRGVYPLEARHAASITALGGEADIRTHASLLLPAPGEDAKQFVIRQIAARAAGTAYAFAIEASHRLIGAVGLLDVTGGQARALVCWVGAPHRRQGYGSFAIGITLEFAFKNLRLDSVQAPSTASEAGRRLVIAHGFATPTEVQPAGLERRAWLAHRHSSALARLHPALRGILDAELAAGNEVIDASCETPEPGSVFVRLRRPFVARPATLPAEVTYHEPDDPHWWRAEYSTRAPRHVLAC